MDSAWKAGLEDVIAARSAVCAIDGAAGRLYYRGYEIGDLAGVVPFEDVVWLLWFGELPSAAQAGEFRARLLDGNAEKLLFDKLLAVCCERKWLKRRGRQRTDSTHVIAAVHAELVGADGDLLFSAIYADDAPLWLREVPAVEMLRRVWVQQYYMQSDLVHWRTEKEGIPPARFVVSSPYDTDARLGRKPGASGRWRPGTGPPSGRTPGC